MGISNWLVATCCFCLTIAVTGVCHAVTPVTCEVRDSETDVLLPCRVYIQSSDGKWYFARPGKADGSAVEYRKSRLTSCVEIHTTVSATPFVVEVPPGRYTFRVERGKEYLPWEQVVEVGDDEVKLRVPLRRWIDMASAGWYSGDTHVHRSIEELPNLLLAEDLNVGLPLTYWVTRSHTAPARGDRAGQAQSRAALIEVDPTHVICPTNTEYEIFHVGSRRHTLGAVLILGHEKPFDLGVPPVRAVAEQARQQGAVLDLDKHSWPWSLMIAHVMKVDLFELANNHCWRTEFGFRQWTIDHVPAYMELERDERGLTEWGWIDFGFQTYYALLNCGLRMRPSAGTASGVHPVPLGFGRVYVHLPDGFRFEKWMDGLAAGRSFVTTGPMLFVEVDGQPPGATVALPDSGEHVCRITGTAASSRPLRSLEIVVSGRVVQRLPAKNTPTDRGGYETPFECRVPLDRSAWLAVRAFEDRPDGRVRFAHSSPVHVEMSGKPLRPRREEVAYLVRRMREELTRNESLLKTESLEEYRQALQTYQQIAETAE
jgi:hypothetical protein